MVANVTSGKVPLVLTSVRNQISRQVSTLASVGSLMPKHIIIDGGTGEELIRRGVPDDRKIWSATAIVNSKYHQHVRQVHKSFLKSGAQLITANNYGISPGVGFTEEEIMQHVGIAVRLAREAREEYLQETNAEIEAVQVLPQRRQLADEYVDDTSKVEAGKDLRSKVAGGEIFVGCSLPPLVESYRPDLVMDDFDSAVRLYRRIVQAVESNVDFLIAETLSSIREMRMAVQGVVGSGVKMLIASFTLRSDGALRSGEDSLSAITDVIDHIHSLGSTCPPLFAVMFNCCEPEAVTKALTHIASKDGEKVRNMLFSKGIRLGIAPNRLTPIDVGWSLGESEAPQALRTDLEPVSFAATWVKEWITIYDGEMLLGGCCGMGPEYIAEIAKFVRKNAHIE